MHHTSFGAVACRSVVGVGSYRRRFLRRCTSPWRAKMAPIAAADGKEGPKRRSRLPLSFLGPQVGWSLRSAKMTSPTSGGVLCGITLGARDWSDSPATPSSSNRFLNLLPVFREMPYSRHRSVSLSPLASFLMNSLRRSMGDFAFQGTGAPPAPGLAGRHPCALSVPSPMYLVCTV